MANRSNRLRAVAIALLGFSLFDAGQVFAQVPAATPPAPADLKAVKAELIAAFAALEDAAGEVPTGSFDPQSLIEQIGREPAKLLEWVRDQTWLAPYRGSLRGASGVLQDRVGSSLDRSLLLAELLRTAGLEVRLARGAVADTARVAAAIRPIPAQRLDDRPATESDPQTAALTARVAKHADGLLKALADSGLAPKADAGVTPLAWPEVLGDHWWVQLKQGDNWIDADPTLPTAKLGDRLADANSTVAAPGDDGTLAKLPPDQVHTVEVKVVVERLEAGKLLEASPLTISLRPAEMHGKRIVYTHVPVAYKKTSTAPLSEQTKAIIAVTEFIPTFSINGASTVNDSVTDTGQINSSPSLDQTAGMSKATGNTLGGIGGGLTGGDTSAAATGVWTAEWLEFTVRTSGKPSHTIRREVFDLIGPSARAKGAVTPPKMDDSVRLDRALALVGQTDLLSFGAQPTPEFITHQYVQSLQKVKRRVLATVDARIAAAASGKDQPVKRLDFDPRTLSLSPAWGVATGRLTVSPVANDVYLNTMNVFCLTRRARISADGTPMHITRTDLAINDVAVRQGPDAFATRVKQGVADTAMEAYVVESFANFIGAKETAATNTVNLFDAAQAAPVTLPSRAADLSAWSADARARAGQSIAGGAVLLATAQPSATGQVGWWKVDPATGTTIGVTGDGYHSATTERGMIEARVNALTDVPFNMTFNQMRGTTQKEFVQMVAGGKGLSGMRLLRAVREACRLHELILAL